MRTAAFSTALIFGGLFRLFGAVLFGIWASGYRRGMERCQADPHPNFYAAPIQTQTEPARIPTCRGSFLWVKESTHARYGIADRICFCLFGDSPRPIDQSVVTAACLGTRPSACMVLSIGAIREEAQRGLVHPRRDAIGRRPNLLITNDGPVERRLLGPITVVDPCGDAAGWWFILDAAADL